MNAFSNVDLNQKLKGDYSYFALYGSFSMYFPLNKGKNTVYCTRLKKKATMTHCMDFTDVDQVLDKRVVLRYSGNLPVSSFSHNFNYSFQFGLNFAENELELSYFIPEEMAESREIAIFIAQSKAKKEGGLYFVNYNLPEPTLFNALKSVGTASRSTVMDSLQLKNGEYYLSIRFNKNELKAISDILLKYSGEIPRLSVDYLGNNNGLESVLSQINEESNLVRFEWEVNVPRDSRTVEPFMSLGSEWVSEIRFMSKSDKISHIVRTKETMESPERNGLYPVSPGDNLYEHQIRADELLLSNFHESANAAKLLRFGRILHYKDGLLRIASIIPKVQIGEMLRILRKCSEDFQDWNLTLSNIQDL